MLGNCMGPGGNVARVCALGRRAGYGVPGLTVDRQCGSGLAAILVAAQAVRAGETDLVIAGGVESASTAPVRAHRGPDGARPSRTRGRRSPRPASPTRTWARRRRRSPRRAG